MSSANEADSGEPVAVSISLSELEMSKTALTSEGEAAEEDRGGGMAGASPPLEVSDTAHPPSSNSRRKVVCDPKINYSELRVHMITWNIASTEPTLHDIESLFLPQQSCMLQDVFKESDIIVIGLQEAYQSVPDVMQSSVPLVGKDPLVELFSNFVCNKGFVRLSAARLLGILTLVFVKKPLLCYIYGTDTYTTKTGMGGWVGNKGAASIHFTLCERTLCFTNCHLVPHPENNPRRTQELGEILTSKGFDSTPAQLMEHDILVLFGDMNFRLEGKSQEQVMEVLSRGRGAELLSYDQLRLEQIRGVKSASRLFQFMEMPISFQPSYKFEPGTDTYEGGLKKRVPAWCDRVLWRTHERVLPRITDPDPRPVLTQQHYAIHMQPRISDHKPVSAGLTLSINLSKYMPRVVFNIMTEWEAGKQGIVAFEMASNTEVSLWDWIGLYPENFASMEKDYLFWIYTPVKGKPVKGKVYSRTLTPDQVPSEPGRYMLLYKSSQYDCALGMSPIFPIR